MLLLLFIWYQSQLILETLKLNNVSKENYVDEERDLHISIHIYIYTQLYSIAF